MRQVEQAVSLKESDAASVNLGLGTDGARKPVVAVGVNHQRQVGIAMIDLSSPYELILTDILDSHNYVDAISYLRLQEVRLDNLRMHVCNACIAI